MRQLIKKSWSTSWPIVLIMFFEFIINLTDVYVAGRLGKEYQAAVGLVSQFYFIFIVIGNALTTGTVAVISRQFKSDRQAFAATAFTTALTVAFLGLALGLPGAVLSPHIISALNIPESVKPLAMPLISIYSASLVFHYFLINSNGILRASEGIRKTLATMAVVAVLNIPLNIIFVFFTPLGYYGIALSTAVSVATGSLINLFHISRLVGSIRKFSGAALRKIIPIAWPMGLAQISWQLGSSVLFLIISSLPRNNVEILAALTNGLRIESAIFLPAFAFNMASAVITGNLLGEKKHEEAYRSGLVSAALGVFIIIILTLRVGLNARPLASFLSGNPVVVDESVRYIYISMISEPFMAWAAILGGALNGAGDTRATMIIVTSCFWIVRIPLAYILGIVLGLGAPAIWWSMNASIFAHSLLMTRRYYQRRWLHNA